MKSKIAFKLTLYFGIVLLLFAAGMGVIFMSLFRTHTIALYEDELQSRAEVMAATLSGLMDSQTSSGMGNGKKNGGYGAYLRYLDEIAMTDVWIVDENMELIISPQMEHQYQYTDLPEDAEEVVQEVFSGKTTLSEGFSSLLDKPTLTVGTPVISGDGQVIACLLLHTPVEGMDEAVAQGFNLLAISTGAALVLAILLAVILARFFYKAFKQDEGHRD